MRFSTSVLLLSVSVLGACADVDAPDDLRLSCDSDDECPAGYSCDEALGVCQKGTVVVDRLALVDSDADVDIVGDPVVEAGGSVALRFTFNTAPREAPRVRLVGDVDDIAVVDSEADGDDLHYVARYTPTGEEPETTARVLLDTIDARGVEAVLATTTTLTFDYTGPQAVAVSLQRVPDPQRTPVAVDILDETDIGPNIDVRLIFSTDEAVVLEGEDAPAVVTVGPGALAFARDPRSSNPLIFELTWPADVGDGEGRYDGAHDVVVRLQDLAGNVSEGVIDVVDIDGDGIADSGLVVDGTGPDAPDVDGAGTVVFERAPWGTLSDARPELYRLVGAADSVEAGSRVIVTRNEALRFELARVAVDDDGGFVVAELPIGDVATVFVRATDAAGNVGPAVSVRDVRWVVTPLGKRAGSTLENPHTFEDAPLFLPQRVQGGLVDRGGDEGIGLANDGDVLATVGGGTWRQVAQAAVDFSDGDPSSGLFDTTIVSDPVHGITLLLGRGRLGDAAGLNTGVISRTTCSLPVTDVKVRDAEGRFRQGPPLPIAVGDAVVAAFVPTKGRTFALGRNGVTASFDGTSWREECVGGGCIDADAAAAAPQGAMAWDSKRRVLVAVSNGRIVELDPAGPIHWRDTTVVAPGDGRAVFHERAGVVVFYDGDLVGWDGTALASLCTGACVATAPAPQIGGRIAYDKTHGEVVMFGGQGDVPCNFRTGDDVIRSQGLAPLATPGPGDTWTFDGASWTRHTPTSTPAARTRHAMAWDPLQARVLLVGGDDCECMSSDRGGLRSANMIPGLPNDAWQWDGTTWTPLPSLPSPPSFFSVGPPPPTRDHSVIEAPDVGGVILIGDDNDDDRDVVHLFRDDRWQQRTVNASAVAPLMAAWATSPTGEIVGFGGARFGLNGVLEPPGNRFHVRMSGGDVGLACPAGPSSATCLAPIDGPWGAAAWHDGVDFYVHGGVGRFNIFGDDDPLPADSSSDRLLAWNAVDGWRDVCVDAACRANAPGRRLLHRAVLDGDGHAVMFGGLVAATTTTDESWQWDGTRWTATTGPRPPARAAHVLAYDVDRDAVIVAYGTDLGGQRFEQPFGQGIVPLEPYDIPEALSEVWEFADGAWTPVVHVDVENDGRPSPRSSVSGAGLPGGGVVLFGGTPSPAVTYGETADFFGPTPRNDETWVWNGAADRGPGHRLIVRTDRSVSLLDDDDELQQIEVRWRSRAARSNDVAADDVVLVWWDGDGWVAIDDDHAIDCGAGCVGGVVEDDAARRALNGGFADTIAVAATTKTPNGPAPGRAQLVTDGVEVVMSWRRAAAVPDVDLP